MPSKYFKKFLRCFHITRFVVESSPSLCQSWISDSLKKFPTLSVDKYFQKKNPVKQIYSTFACSVV